MLRSLRRKLDFTRGLGFRLVWLLSIAILPVGLISVVQTLSLTREAERNAEIALIGLTASAATGQRALLQQALGAADALGPSVIQTIDDPAQCAELLRGFVQRSATYVYAGFMPVSGVSDCTSTARVGQPVDVRASSVFKSFIAEPRTIITRLDRGPVSGQSVALIVHPLYRDAELLGYVAVSLTQEMLRSTHSDMSGTTDARVVTFNDMGELLTTDIDLAQDDLSYLPAGLSLVDLPARNGSTFRAPSNFGDQRVFTVTEVVPDLVYAVGSWNPKSVGIAGVELSRLAAMAVPVALWAVSLIVAYFAVYRLVLRHISELRSQMRRFAIGNRDVPPKVLTDAPAEIADVSQTFHNMARILIRDEDAMERAVSEKTVLLKEVHHRVKNNLQLIASIINMQSRAVADPDAKRVLRAVQDRVAALATIYRNLYQAEHLNQVEADRLISDIVNHMINIAGVSDSSLKIETHFDPLALLPDQAVPLSLLTTEAFTNALKYAGVAPGQDRAWLRVSLRVPEPDRAIIEIVNSTGTREIQHDGTGLGNQLIEAFAMQLEGEVAQGMDGNSFFMRLSFAVDAVPQRDSDDQRNVFLTSAARTGARH